MLRKFASHLHDTGGAQDFSKFIQEIARRAKNGFVNKRNNGKRVRPDAAHPFSLRTWFHWLKYFCDGANWVRIELLLADFNTDIHYQVVPPKRIRGIQGHR